MKVARNKSITLALSVLLLILNIAVQFSHRHVYEDEAYSIKHAGGANEHTGNSALHDLVCVACQFLVTYIATSTQGAALRTRPNSTLLQTEQCALLSTFLQTSCSPRAPPV